MESAVTELGLVTKLGAGRKFKFHEGNDERREGQGEILKKTNDEKGSRQQMKGNGEHGLLLIEMKM